MAANSTSSTLEHCCNYEFENLCHCGMHSHNPIMHLSNECPVSVWTPASLQKMRSVFSCSLTHRCDHQSRVVEIHRSSRHSCLLKQVLRFVVYNLWVETVLCCFLRDWSIWNRYLISHYHHSCIHAAILEHFQIKDLAFCTWIIYIPYDSEMMVCQMVI